MTAFVSFVQAYAIWLFLLCGLGILIGIKMLADAQRLAHTTLFSLEQERAGEQTYRAVIVIFLMLATMVAVTTINILGVMFVPAPVPPIARGLTPTLPAIVFASATPSPTRTFTPIAPTETPFVPPTAPLAPTPTRTARPAAPPAPTPTPVYALPPPMLTAPPNGNVFTGFGQANAAITFRWTWTCDSCKLGPNERFVVTISFIDLTGKPAFIGGSTQNNYLAMGDILRGSGAEAWHQAKEDTFEWYVQVKRGDQPLTAPSAVWKFVWH